MQIRSKQLGGTLLGLVVGLAIGVAVAVAIAFWFGKQSPVVNKMQPKGSLSDAEEIDKNKTWDPNANLFGKAVPPSLQTIAANAAALGETTSTEPTPNASQAKPATPVLASSAAVAVKPKATASSSADGTDPLGDMIKARAKAKAKAASAAAAAVSVTPESPSASGLQTTTLTSAKPANKVEPRTSPASSAGDGGVYFVQVGAFRTPEDANAQKAKLALLGIETKVTEREQSGKTVFRVRAGVFKKVDEAEAMKFKLDKAGFDAVLVKAPI